jgi:hypothetical protein
VYNTLKHARGLITLWLYKETKSNRTEKNTFTPNTPPGAAHTYDFVVLTTSLIHPRKIIFILQIGKQEIIRTKELSALLRTNIRDVMCTH